VWRDIQQPFSVSCVCITAKPGEFISLEFIKMLTECSYDYVFVYDGNTYNSPLLGSFSGETIPDVLVASSQYVSMPGILLLRLVQNGPSCLCEIFFFFFYYFSDCNYVR